MTATPKALGTHTVEATVAHLSGLPSITGIGALRLCYLMPRQQAATLQAYPVSEKEGLNLLDDQLLIYLRGFVRRTMVANASHPTKGKLAVIAKSISFNFIRDLA